MKVTNLTHSRAVNRRSRFTPFTLVELLTVIAIIALLASMLVPALSKARTKGKYGRWLGFKNQMRADDGLVLFHTFEDTSLSTLSNLAIGDPLNNEENVQSYETTMTGPTWVSGGGRWSGKASLSFDGFDDRLVSNYKGISGGSSRTISAWVKTSSTANQAICAWGVAGPMTKWVVRVNTGTGALRTESGAGQIFGSVNIGDGEWHHIVSSFDNDGTPDVQETVLYVDGVADTSTGGIAQTVATDTDNGIFLRIGAHQSGGFFDGKIDEFALFNRALSASEVEELYKMGQP